MTYLKLTIKGILQAYGKEGDFLSMRSTAYMPTKRAVVGMIGAAMGIDYNEKDKLADLANSFEIKVDPIKKMPLIYHDYQIVQPSESRTTEYDVSLPSFKGGKSSTGQSKIVHKDYIMDQEYTIKIFGKKDFLEKIIHAFTYPFYTIYLGRKNCIPGKFEFELCEERQEIA